MSSVASFVLIIDFEPRSLAKSRAQLEKAGFPVRTASNGKQIQEVFDSEIPSVVLMEPMLPGQDGFKLCQAIRRRRADTPVFVASRIYRGQRYRNMAKEAGATGYFERPQQDDVLLAAIARHLPAQAAEEAPSSGATASVGASNRSATVDTGTFVIPFPEPPAKSHQETARTKPAAAATAPPVASAPAASHPKSFPTAASHGAGFLALGSTPRSGSNLGELSDGDIDDALSRLLGDDAPDATSSQGARGATPIAKVQYEAHGAVAVASRDDEPFDFSSFDLTAEQSGAIDLDELGLALDETELTGVMRPAPAPAPAPAPVAAAPAAIAQPLLESLPAFDLVEPGSPPIRAVRPAEHHAAIADPGYRLDLDEQFSAPVVEQAPITERAPAERDSVSATPGAPEVAPAASANVSAAASPSHDASGLEGVDAFFDQNFSPASPEDDNVHASSPQFDASRRGITGGALADPALDGEAARDTGPPPFASDAHEVPASLRGMDRGTAELLSTLEELENSLPQPDLGQHTGWGDGSEYDSSLSSLSSLQSLETGASGVVHTPPPASEEERSLEEMLARLSTGDEPLPRAATPAVAASPTPSAQPSVADSELGREVDAAFGFDPGSSSNRSAQEEFDDLDFGIEQIGGGHSRGAGATGRSGPATGPGVSSQPPVRGSASPAVPQYATRPPLESPVVPLADVRAEATHESRSERSATGPAARRMAPRIALESLDQSTGGRILGLSSVLWYALIGVVLGAVALYLVFSFLGRSDESAGLAPAAQVQPTTQNRPEQSAVPAATPSGSNPAPTASNAPAPRELSRKPATPPDAGATRRRESPATNPGETGSRPKRTSPSPASAVVPAGRTEEAAANAAAILRDRPQPVLATPDAGEPAPSFATGPGFDAPAPLVKLSELDAPLQLKSRAGAELPAAAAQAGVAGRVFLNVLVGEDGSVRDTRVMIEPGFGLGDAAQRAARSWTYGRPTAGGAPARVWKTEVVEFGDGSGDKTGPTDEPSGGDSGAESGEAAGDPPPQTP